MTDMMIQTSELTYTYPGGRQIRFPDLACRRGETLLITGPSGSGKTTLLHLLAGLIRPADGTVNVAGTPIGSLSTPKMDAFRGQHIGIIFQRSHFIGSLSVADNLLLPLRLTGAAADHKRLEAVAADLRIDHLLHQLPARLSQGEQQRASIARAVLPSPNVILADEPTASLDDRNCEAVARLLSEQAARHNAALLIVTHDNRLTSLFPQHIQLP
ncbi:ABC transporter ATP-binding protein [Chitinophaga rhizosphaerae]|uniref:ABC transporter ATP-binding protein n=1 Tax=Chitinophaga rhizosphaerae TaxID=1864947 RepID=UPI00196B6FAC|nr:ATP-binding cassette domain-containing protein [Chitinophaga rhizosphaerae]